MDLQELFSSPPSAYRGKPFWAWNGLLEEEELRRQIRIFRRMGLGGAFMHSRVGLATPYLSEEWFKMVKACVDEAKKIEIEAWLYDEDRWPSGAAGGLVTKDVRCRQRRLRMEVVDPEKFSPSGEELGVFLARVEGNRASKVRQIRPEDASRAAPGEKVLAFYCRVADPSPWYNNQTYLDTLSAEAVRRFIEVTYEAYAREVGEEFGSTVPGIFTDEPNYGNLCMTPDGGEAPWTDKLPDAFRERYGYDLLPHLPEVFFEVDGEEFSKVRRDYYDCLTHLFSRNFGEQIGRWCGEHNLLFTGHVLAEGTLRSQTSVVGSTMRFYEFMQAPGIDILCGQGLTRPGGCPPEYATAKQCSSVAHQFGRKWVLSELYGCTGWHFTFAEHKAVGDWQAALGVNLRCQHLSWYTMAGEAKRDYPASIFFQSPWWRDYPVVEDYFARVGVLMTQGEPVRDIAVIHPIESAWGVFYADVGEPLDRLEGQFETLQNLLLEEHFDFDYIDEDILSRHGSVEGDCLRVAEAKYRVVVVPPMLTIRESTRKTLEEFIEAGGNLIFVEPIPERVDALPSEGAKKLAGRAVQVPLERKRIADALSATGKIRRVSIRTEEGEEFRNSLYMLRYDEKTGRFLAFICHTRQDEESGPLVVRMPGRGQVQEWDPQTGEVFSADAEQEGEEVAIRTELPGVGSRIFVVDPNPRQDLRARPKFHEIRRQTIKRDRWPILRDEPNAFPLDVAEFSINGGPWQGPQEVLKIDMAVRDAMGLPHRGGRMCQPWADKPPDVKPVPLKLRFRFGVESLPRGTCHLVLEEPGRYRTFLNGYELDPDEDEGWWIDKSFRKIPVAPWCLKEGENELILETEYGPTHGLESLYFAGEFGVRLEGRRFVVTELPTGLAIGDWTAQGFPCYTGTVSYITDFEVSFSDQERVFLELPSWQGVLVKVRVNGRSVGAIAWPPYELDITEALRDGVNRLEIQVTGSRRNLLGPLHNVEKYPRWTGPGQFLTTGEAWTDDYVLLPYGLMQDPVLSVRVNEGRRP